MGIFTRLTDIINSNISHLLDKAEDPDKMIRMMIQEMEDTLVEVRSSAARVIADRKELDRNLVRLKKVEDDWLAKAELALSKDREDLANAALIEKSKLVDLAQELEQDRAPLEEALKKYEDDIVRLEAKIKEAKQKQKTLIERKNSAESQLRVRAKLYDNRIEDVMNRFHLMEKRVEETESRVEAQELGREKSLHEEFADLEAAENVADELEELKAKLAKKNAKDEKK
ncbi:phage shock protein PspA [Pseudemcibacter aquimaris]|uniref:phage shock protein PspA n=1 Tax=Pseudemcibacter aquimaris TaxID=2857064 RepID=UPI00201162BA|nr:phage shock protein PspA [Pseudemcibacter aquimaris]MCC3861674.1 phage shock protein PspA [Pseudemcibacter aquimaris]WDU58445.1 phage shock protein PspA [Pseudemcibacter aquimaris]